MTYDESHARGFFEYWEKQLEAIQVLIKNGYEASAEILMYAYFDTLANLWARSIKSTLEFKSDKRRFGEFLSECSGRPDIFQKMCAPDLWSRAERVEQQEIQRVRAGNKRVYSFSDEQLHSLKFCAGRQEKLKNEHIDEHHRQADPLREIQEDPTVDVLMTKLNDIALNSNIGGGRSGREWLLDSRMGEVAYRYRCSWIHEGRIPNIGHPFFRDENKQPNYLSLVNASSWLIDFPPTLMRTVLKTCLEQFETQAKNLRCDPAPPPHNFY